MKLETTVCIRQSCLEKTKFEVAGKSNRLPPHLHFHFTFPLYQRHDPMVVSPLKAPTLAGYGMATLAAEGRHLIPRFALNFCYGVVSVVHVRYASTLVSPNEKDEKCE